CMHYYQLKQPGEGHLDIFISVSKYFEFEKSTAFQRGPEIRARFMLWLWDISLPSHNRMNEQSPICCFMFCCITCIQKAETETYEITIMSVAVLFCAFFSNSVSCYWSFFSCAYRSEPYKFKFTSLFVDDAFHFAAVLHLFLIWCQGKSEPILLWKKVLLLDIV
ncbi:hypothetical protein ACJX0J_038290, partial [Zea mays]